MENHDSLYWENFRWKDFLAATPTRYAMPWPFAGNVAQKVSALNCKNEVFVVVGVGTNRKKVERAVYLALAVASFPSFRRTASDSQMQEFDSRFISFCDDIHRDIQIANPNSMFGTHVIASMDYYPTKAGYLMLQKGDVVQVLSHHAHRGDEYSDFFRWYIFGKRTVFWENLGSLSNVQIKS